VTLDPVEPITFKFEDEIDWTEGDTEAKQSIELELVWRREAQTAEEGALNVERTPREGPAVSVVVRRDQHARTVPHVRHHRFRPTAASGLALGGGFPSAGDAPQLLLAP
jgi:hypothetical protein